ncbi:MAG TPA: hypothetical protein PLD85_00700 [Spirochaetota bacterium]|nr:hypothetical protein [Spirochaetota bacterium]
MNDDDRVKRLEREARKLILSKEISADIRAKINSIMKDSLKSQEDKSREIIRLLRNEPDKEIVPLDDSLYNKKEKIVQKRNIRPSIQKVENSFHDIPDTRSPRVGAPTETSLYIDDIFTKYRRFKLFKKRRLIRKNNWLGLGFNKRLIPAKRFFEVLTIVRKYQNTVLERLSSIIETILQDELIESPEVYNYLKVLRRWISFSPFSAIPQARIRWMDQWDFERELRSFVINHYAFLKIDLKARERILSTVENILRKQLSEDTENFKSAYAVDKEIYQYMGSLRSFITIGGESDSLLAQELRQSFDIYSLTEFLNMAMEALVFKRPFAITELRDYYNIYPVTVSTEVWDCSPEKLKACGKDPLSLKQKRIDKLSRELLWFDIVYGLVKYDESGVNILDRAAEIQWKAIDRVNRDPEETLKNNFLVYLESLVHYFNNIILPLINGSTLVFEREGEIVESSIFEPSAFQEEIENFSSLMDDFFSFRSSNPTLKILYDEVKKIVQKRISSLDHVEKLIYKTGSVFYAFGKKLSEVYYSHVTLDQEYKFRTIPIAEEDLNSEGLVVPFASYTLRDVVASSASVKRFKGQRILSDSMKGGVFVYLMAYCFQMANIVEYPLIKNDIAKREILKKELKGLKGDLNDT